MLPGCCSPGEDFGYGTHKTHITGAPVSTMDREDGLSPASFYVCYGLNLGCMIGIQNMQFVLAAVYTEDNVGRLRDSVIGSAIVFVSWIRSLRAHGRPVRGPCTPFFHPLPPRAPSLCQLQKLLQLCTALYSLHYIHFTVCTHISLEKPVV